MLFINITEPLKITDHCGTDKNSAIFEHLFNCTTCQNSDIVQNFKVLKRCKQSELYSLESILIEEEQPNLNTEVALNGKKKLINNLLINIPIL